MIPAQAIPFITKEEGCKLVPYKDICGKYTVGVGHLCLDSEYPFQPITQAQADAHLLVDLSFADKCLDRHVKVPLNDNERTALLSWVFNLGCTAVSQSTLLRVLNLGDRQHAAAELPRWCYADGKRIEALHKRRLREQSLFLKPV